MEQTNTLFAIITTAVSITSISMAFINSNKLALKERRVVELEKELKLAKMLHVSRQDNLKGKIRIYKKELELIKVQCTEKQREIETGAELMRTKDELHKTEILLLKSDCTKLKENLSKNMIEKDGKENGNV